MSALRVRGVTGPGSTRTRAILLIVLACAVSACGKPVWMGDDAAGNEMSRVEPARDGPVRAGVPATPDPPPWPPAAYEGSTTNL